jgi:hypothetical protein
MYFKKIPQRKKYIIFFKYMYINQNIRKPTKVIKVMTFKQIFSRIMLKKIARNAKGSPIWSHWLALLSYAKKCVSLTCVNSEGSEASLERKMKMGRQEAGMEDCRALTPLRLHVLNYVCT